MSGNTKEVIDHAADLAKKLSDLHLNGEFADITFIIEKQRISAHRCILASRSSYFRGLLFGGFSESNKNEIELDVNLAAFNIFMEYLYVGSISVANYEDNLLTDTLSLANEYGCLEFVSCLIEILCKRLNSDNVFFFTKTAQFHGFDSFVKICFDFIDANANSLLGHESFKTLSKELLSEIIRRDSFSADEVDIFKAILVWRNGQTQEDLAIVLEHVRFTLMQIEELQNIVKPSSLLTTEKIDSIIEEIKARNDLPFRCGKKHRLEMDCLLYDMEIEHNILKILFNKPFLLKLSRGQTINYIALMGCQGLFSYYIEVSDDRKEWTRIVDYSKHICHSTQHLYFDPILVHYIYIKRVFRSNREMNVGILIQNSLPKVVNGFYVAPCHFFQKNYQCRFDAIIEKKSCTITLSQPFYINSCKIENIGPFNVHFVETSVDGKNFKKLEIFKSSVGRFYFEAHIVNTMKIGFSYWMSDNIKRITLHVSFVELENKN